MTFPWRPTLVFTFDGVCVLIIVLLRDSAGLLPQDLKEELLGGALLEGKLEGLELAEANDQSVEGDPVEAFESDLLEDAAAVVAVAARTLVRAVELSEQAHLERLRGVPTR